MDRCLRLPGVFMRHKVEQGKENGQDFIYPDHSLCPVIARLLYLLSRACGDWGELRRLKYPLGGYEELEGERTYYHQCGECQAN